MAKQAILDVLEKTIGKYVKNLDAESLNVAVWQGQIELHSLELNLDAINAELARQAAESPNLAIPFRVIDGSFGSLHVEVPWTRITSRSVVFRAKGLKVTVEPWDILSATDLLADPDMSEKKRIEKIQERRMQSLKSADVYRMQANALRKLAEQDVPTGGSGSKGAENASFSENLVRRIIENIQVDVEDVHIALKGKGSAAGVVLESLSLATTDKNGERKFVDRNIKGTNADDIFLYKALQINGLGVYLDELTPFAKSKAVQQQEHSFVLSPLSFDAKLRQAAGVKCVDFPKYLLRSELSQMSILLSKTQLELGNKIALAVSPPKNAARPLFPEYRPVKHINKESAKEWWLYAFRCVGRLNGWGLWLDFYDAFKKRKLYIPLYKRAAHHESCPWMEPLSTEEKAELDKIEMDRMISSEGIMAWRSIADAQAEREQQKHDHAKKKNAASSAGVLASFFGSTAKPDSKTDSDDDPPITLSVEEMQELEALALAQTTEAELSKDSKLCDVTFVLGSFKVNLVGHTKQLAAFEMGTATTSFDANADGSYIFDTSLASLEVHDRVTVHSLFPTVVRNVQSVDESMAEDIFKFRLQKSRTADQNIILKLAAVEMVASQMLLSEVKSFFTLSGPSSAQKGTHQNPMLAQSLSGTVDLFYDAEPGIEPKIVFGLSEGTAAATEKISDTLSLAMIDAWNSKNKEKTKWTVHCDIHAPVLVIPESCSSLEANVLVFDFGRLKFDYGKSEVEPKVKSWFDEQPKPSKDDCIIDPGSLGISELTFTVGRAGDFHWRPAANISDHVDVRKTDTSTIIKPVSASLDFGIQSFPTRDEPSICAHGVIPVISLSTSPSQISRALSVYMGWKSVISEFTGKKSDQKKYGAVDDQHGVDGAGGVTILEEGHDEDSRTGSIVSASSAIRQSRLRRSSYSSPLSVVKTSLPKKDHDVFTTLHVSMGLQQLSVRVLSDTGEGMEAHLVSVSASTSQKSDGTASNHLRMGWFWVLDHFSYMHPRRQRLVLHSTLPRTAASFAREGSYDILGALRAQGVFKKDYSGSNELADITLTTRGAVDNTTLPDKTPFSSKDPFAVESEDIDSFLNAQFSSLYVHWNPQAVKAMIQAFGRSIASLQDVYTSNVTSNQTRPRRASFEYLSIQSGESPSKTSLGGSFRDLKKARTATARTTMLVKSKLKSLEITLDSAKDDEALFILAMSDTKVQILSSQVEEDSNTLVSVELGDLSIGTPETSGTNPAYRTVLGLAPEHCTSLLSVNFSLGEEAVQGSCLEGVDPSKCDMCAEFTLSPMRFVYIQAQVMTLVEYITEGILGALTAQAASSAAEAAAAIGQSTREEQYFVVKATGIDVIIPQSADSKHYVALCAGSSLVKYRGLSGPGGGEAHVSLSDVSMRDSENQKMLNFPVRMGVDVTLPPGDIGSMDDRAMQISISISQAAFLLTHNQYQLLMWILERNVGEADPHLRLSAESVPHGALSNDVQEDTHIGGIELPQSTEAITHAGVAAIDVKNRMYLRFNLDALSLEFCGVDISDTIVDISAVEASISMKLLPDKETMWIEAALHNLTCDDRRLDSMGRPFRSLISQVEGNEPDLGADSCDDVFHASYKKIGETSCEVDLKLGSPRLVFIPDVIADVLQFLKTDQKPINRSEERQEINAEKPAEDQVVEIQVEANEESVEAAFVSLVDTTSMTLSIKTANCSIVLIDMGNSTEPLVGGASSSLIMSRTPVTETIVLQGQFDARMSISSQIESGQFISVSAELHGECMEVYTAFGSKFTSPIQVMEPASVSTFFTFKPAGENTKELNIRFVTLSPVDITFSMQNAALINAITSSCVDCFNIGEIDMVGEGAPAPLSDLEASRIEALASALESHNVLKRDSSSALQEQSTVDESSVSIKSEAMDSMSIITRVQVTMTETKLTIVNDLQGLEEPLFRLNASNFVAGAEVHQGIAASLDSLSQTTFHFQVNSSLMADYFDSSVQLWKVLLKKPWEITVKCSRDPSTRSGSDRMSTVLDIEAYPCLLSFSEQFLVSLAAASKMWSIYSIATTKATEGDKNVRSNGQGSRKSTSKKALAASAARHLITSLPYAVENHSGLDVAFLLPSSNERRSCPSGTMQYFRFEPPQGRGSGGHRQYGQDVTRLKEIILFVSGKTISIEHIDAELSRPRHAHDLGEGEYLLSFAAKEGKTTVLHLSSPIDVHNCTSVPFRISVTAGNKDHDIGVCAGHQGDTLNLVASRATFDVMEGRFSKASRFFGIPVDLLSGEVRAHCLRLSPNTDFGLFGDVAIPSLAEVLSHLAAGDTIVKRFDISCSSPRKCDQNWETGRPPDPFVLQACFKMTLIENKHPFIEIFLEPRIVIENKMPIGLTVRTPMPHTFKGEVSLATREAVDDDAHEVLHKLAPGEIVEVFTPGPSIALSVKCSDPPVGGRTTDWMEGGWIDVPLARGFGLPEPLKCVFPFVQRSIPGQPDSRVVGGSEFFVVESGDDLAKLLLAAEEAPAYGNYLAGEGIELVAQSASMRKVLLTVCNYAVDHTGDVLFEMVENNGIKRRTSQAAGWSVHGPAPFSAFSSRHRRITLLPHGSAPLRLLHLTMEGDEGVQRSQAFCLDDISISEGGVDSTAIRWEDGSDSGYFAYRRLIDTYQFEMHVVPEFIIFNGSKNQIFIRQQNGTGKIVQPGQILPLRSIPKVGLVVSIEFFDFDGRTSAMRVDSLGLRVAVVRSLDGSPLGSLAVQTVIGNRDSRLVVKLGKMKIGSLSGSDNARMPISQGMFDKDVVRFRIRWTELQVTLNEGRPLDPDDVRNAPFILSSLDAMYDNISRSAETPHSPFRRERKKSPRQQTWVEAQSVHSQEQIEIERQTQLPVCTVILRQFTVDWQRVFNDAGENQKTHQDVLNSPERSQFSAIIHHVQILDETPKTEFPIVFDSTSGTSFFDLCIRFRGPLTAELAKIDLLDLKLAHAENKSEKVVVQTTEDFLWRAMDVSNRILVSTAELTGIDLRLEWNEEEEGFVVSVADSAKQDFDTEALYTPPQSDRLYDISKARVSPFEMQVSFKRRPNASRYKNLKDVRGAKLMNYFTQRLKFKIDRADLRFGRYEVTDVKGPPDRLIEMMLAVYMSRMKMKAVAMLTAVSVQDWRNLAARDVGADDFVEGDVLRVTGNLAGTTAGYIFKKVGDGLGDGVHGLTRTLGNEIEEATGKVGARAVGAGVNSVVTGIGGGVGSTIKGVGSGAGKVFKGAGQGAGHIFGGVTGGATMAAKGIGKGVRTGDGGAVLSGFAQGASSVGNGVSQGVESVVMGAADGVFTVGQGVASGVKSIGKGVFGAFSGGKKSDRNSQRGSR